MKYLSYVLFGSLALSLGVSTAWSATKETACKDAFLKDPNRQTECLETRTTDPEVIAHCGHLYTSRTDYQLTCMGARSIPIITACRNAFSDETNELDCMHATRSEDLVDTCRVFSDEGDRLSCIANAFSSEAVTDCVRSQADEGTKAQLACIKGGLEPNRSIR